MSFWTRLAAAANETYSSATLPMGLEWTFARNLKDERSVSEAIKATQQRPLERPGLGASLDALHVPYQLATHALVTAQAMNPWEQGWSSWGDPKRWEKAWNETQDISPGQSQLVATSHLSSALWGGERLGYGPEDEQDRRRFFEDNWAGRVSSGALDLIDNLTLDPLLGAGKAAKAVRLARTTVKAVDVAPALAHSVGFYTAQGRAAKIGTTLEKLWADTDRMSFDELASLKQFRSTPDASVLAAMFAEANRIPDKRVRWAAKRDIFGAALGSTESIVKLRAENAGLAAAMKRFVTPMETSVGAAAFHFDDFGLKQITYYNQPEKLQEVLARQDAIRAEAARLQRLTDIIGTTNQVGEGLGERVAANVGLQRVRESIMYGGFGQRPVRVLSAATGASIPGHVNTENVDQGYQELAQYLGRSKYLAPEAKAKYLQDWISAPDKAARNEVLYRVENGFYTAAGEAHGYTHREIRALYHSTTGVRKRVRDALRSRVYTGAESGDLVVHIDEDGLAHAFSGPWLKTQFANTVPLTDPKAIDEVIKTDKNTRWLERFAKRYDFLSTEGATAAHNAANRTADIFDSLAQFAMKWWQSSVLFRLAYPIRVQVDTQLRLLAGLGVLDYAMTAKAGAVNSVINRAGVLGAIPGGRVANSEYPQLASDLSARIFDLTDEINKAIKGDPERATRLINDRRKLRAELDSLPETVRRGRSPDKRSILAERETYKGIPTRPALNPEELALRQRMLGENPNTALLLSDKLSEATAELRRTGGWDVVRPADPNWGQEYLRVMNHQIRNSPTARKVIAGATDDQIVKFVQSNERARKEWNLVKGTFPGSLEQWVNYVRIHTERLLPPDGAKRILGRPLTKGDVVAFFPNVEARPDVHGEAYSVFKNSAFGTFMNEWSQRWFRFASDGPEQVMGRHPLYNARFRDHMKTQADRIDGQFIDEPAFRAMRVAADKLARKDVAETLFDLTTRSNASVSMKLFSPFFAAWEDTMLKWGKLFYDDPSRVVRFGQGWRAPNSLGQVVDDQGNPVRDGVTYNASTGQPITDKSYVGKGEYLVLPEWASPLTSGGNLRIRKDSFNLVFQGEPWWLPGAGPLVQVPTNEIVKRAFPEAVDSPIIKAVLPFGTDYRSVTDQVAPSWLTRARDAFTATVAGGAGTDQYGQVYSMFTAQAWADFNTGKVTEKPNAEKIANQTRNWMILKALLAQASPVSAQPQPRLQFYIDQAHQYRARYGIGKKAPDGSVIDPDWQTKFYEDFPNFFELALSLSTNNTGIVASERAYDATKKYRRFIAQNPDLGWLFVGAQNVGDFASGIYRWQKGTAIGYGQSQTFRSQASPAEAIAKVRAEKGWLQYNQAMTWVNQSLEARGLHSLQQRGAEDLAAAKKAFVEQLGSHNQSWLDAYNSSNSGEVQDLANAALNAMRQDASLVKRPDMQALLTYLQARELIRNTLKARKAAGGSSSLQQPSNSDLDALWGQYTQSLVAYDVGFEQIWNRVLSRDDLTRDLALKE